MGTSSGDPWPVASNGQDANSDMLHPYLTWRTSVMAILVSMGGLVFGFDIGQISGFLAITDYRMRFGTYDPVTDTYYFTNVRAGLIVGLLAIGNLCGAFIAAPVANKFGRRKSISCWSFVFMIGVVVQITSEFAWYQLIIGRFISGLGIGGISICVPLYQSESAPTHIRGTIVCLFQLFITLGILFANIINFGTERIRSSASWRITTGISFFWAMILGFGILFFPESPKFMYRQGHVADARRTMCKLLGVSENSATIAKEIREMREKLDEEQAGGRHAWHEIFSGPRMAYRALLGIGLMSFQQLTGANFFFYYGTVVFGASGMDNPFVIQIILGAVNVFCTLPGLWMIDKFGRRPCLIYGAAWMCMCFLVFASVGHFALDQAEPQATPKAGATMIVFACLFIASFASTWGPMVWGATAELYPPRYRASCMSFAIASNWTWVFMIAFFTPFITSVIDYRYGYVFAGCCAAAAVTVYCFLLEPKARTMEELDTMYVMHVKPWASSTWKAQLKEVRGSVATTICTTVAEEPEFKEQGRVPGESVQESAPWETQAQYV